MSGIQGYNNNFKPTGFEETVSTKLRKNHDNLVKIFNDKFGVEINTDKKDSENNGDLFTLANFQDTIDLLQKETDRIHGGDDKKSKYFGLVFDYINKGIEKISSYLGEYFPKDNNKNDNLDKTTDKKVDNDTDNNGANKVFDEDYANAYNAKRDELLQTYIKKYEQLA